MIDWALAGKIVGFCAACLRLATGGIQLYRTIQDGKSFLVHGHLDPDGAIEVKIQNRSGKDLKVQSLEIVEDSSFWRFALRLVTGLDAVTRLDHLEWSPLTSIPATAPNDEKLSLWGCLGSTKHNVTSYHGRWLRKAMARIEIGGRLKLVSLKKIDEPMPLPGE